MVWLHSGTALIYGALDIDFHRRTSANNSSAAPFVTALIIRRCSGIFNYPITWCGPFDKASLQETITCTIYKWQASICRGSSWNAGLRLQFMVYSGTCCSLSTSSHQQVPSRVSYNNLSLFAPISILSLATICFICITSVLHPVFRLSGLHYRLQPIFFALPFPRWPLAVSCFITAYFRMHPVNEGYIVDIAALWALLTDVLCG
jgi:hypothetical protein